MSGFCADCGHALVADACPGGHTKIEVAPPRPMAVSLPRASVGRRLAGSGVEYMAYSAVMGVLTVFSIVMVLDLVLVPFLALFIAVRDVSSGRYSVAKRIGRMRVVQLGTGLPATDRQALVRNSYYIVLATLMVLPIGLDTLAATLFYACVAVDLLMIAGSSDGRRLGDHLAGTQVVHVKVSK